LKLTTFFIFLHRALKQLDSKFTDETIQKAKEITVKFIVDMYQEGLDNEAEPDKKRQRSAGGNNTAATAVVLEDDDNKGDYFCNWMRSILVVGS
jgi:hypothetical protein